MKTLKKELSVHLTEALLEVCETAALAGVPAKQVEPMMKKAAELSAQFGDFYLYNYNKKKKRIEENRKKKPPRPSCCDRC